MRTDGSCRIEIAHIDPVVFTSIVNHDMRKEILNKLYRMALDGPVSKQALAERMGINYHQLVYQLNNHLREFWTVLEEKKVRGTRMELIGPSSPYAIFIALGKERTLHVFDPLANLYGALAKVGTRCDTCSQKETTRCMSFVNSGCTCVSKPTDEELAILHSNNRKAPLRPVDTAILCALKGISSGQKCTVNIPCEGCAFLRRTIPID